MMHRLAYARPYQPSSSLPGYIDYVGPVGPPAAEKGRMRQVANGVWSAATPGQNYVNLLNLLRHADMQVLTPNQMTMGLLWAKEGTNNAVVIDAVTGATYFGGRKIAANFEEAIELFRKRAARIEYGVDPPEHVYLERKARARTRKRATSRARARTASRLATGGAKPLALTVSPPQPAVTVKTTATEGGDFMDLIREMVGPRSIG